MLQTIRDVGRLTGHAADGDRVARDLQGAARCPLVRDVRGRPRPRTMLVIGRDAAALRGIYVSGGVGFLHELLDIAGGDDVFGDIKRESVQPSNETMLVRAPDVIIELHPGDPPPAETLQKERAVWKLLASVPAVRNGRVHPAVRRVPRRRRPSARTRADAVARVLHPEVFR